MKTQKFGSRSAAVLVAAMAVSGTAMVEEARAAIIIDIQQVGADVVATFSGSWNNSTPSFSFLSYAKINSLSGANAASLNASDDPDESLQASATWLLSGPSESWGTDPSLPTFNTPSESEFDGFSVLRLVGGDGQQTLSLGTDYSYGDEISGTWTFQNTTMAVLGVDRYGAYEYVAGTLGSGGDSITVNLIGSPSAIPGAGLASVASVGLAGLSRRRRR